MRYLLVALLLLACQKDEDIVLEHKILSKVNEDILSIDNLNQVVPENIDQENRNDFEHKYVKNWVNQSVLFQEAEKYGITLSDYEKFMLEDLKKAYIVNRYLKNKYSEKLLVSDREISDFYTSNAVEFTRKTAEYRLTHLFLKEFNGIVHKDIIDTKDLSAVIKKYNFEKEQHDIFPNQDLGFVKENELPEKFFSAVRNVRIGEIIGPISTEKGVHYIQVLAKENAGTIYSLEEVKELISIRLNIVRQAKYRDDLIESLKKEYVIVNNIKK